MKKTMILILILTIVTALAIYISYRIVMPNLLMSAFGRTQKDVYKSVDQDYYCVRYYQTKIKATNERYYILIKKKTFLFDYNYDFISIWAGHFERLVEDSKDGSLPFGNKKANDKIIKEYDANRITTVVSVEYLIDWSKYWLPRWRPAWYYRRPEWFFKLVIPDYKEPPEYARQ